MARAAFALLLVLILSGCTRHTPPAGRWEGTYDSAAAMVAARVEIDSKGNISVSAPNAENVGDNADDRAAMRQHLASDLANGWEEVEPRKMEFDGHTFRKPNGIAPQMVWDAKKKRMYLVVYLGKNPGMTIPLRTVDDFSDDPWAE
jgi:hypothetical protein